MYTSTAISSAVCQMS